jgi:hypothetical protein
VALLAFFGEPRDARAGRVGGRGERRALPAVPGGANRRVQLNILILFK